MSIRTQVVARLIQTAGPRLFRPPAALRFAELPGATATLRAPTRHGEVRCSIYRPADTGGNGLPGVYVNFHGGGYVVGHPEQDDGLCRYLAHRTGCVVVNVDYAVAPQHPFPVAVQQAHDVCQWAAASGAEHGWDGARLIVGGQSAGGGLAAAACRQARDQATFTALLQVLVFAPLDLTIAPEAKRAETPKPRIAPGLARIFNDAYVPDPAGRADPLVSPAASDDLTGLPPALVITAALDSLREEGDRFAAKLSAAGVPVSHKVFAGVDHGFTHEEPVAVALEAYELIAERAMFVLA